MNFLDIFFKRSHAKFASFCCEDDKEAEFEKKNVFRKYFTFRHLLESMAPWEEGNYHRARVSLVREVFSSLTSAKGENLQHQSRNKKSSAVDSDHNHFGVRERKTLFFYLTRE